MKLLVDMNLSPRWVEFLSNQGIPAVHWSTVGRAVATDTELMSYAATNELIVLTHDLDFSAILAATHGEKPSVVQIRATDLRPETLGPSVVGALRQMEADLQAGALLSVDPKRTRIRLLPLKTFTEDNR
jgi:predicted nuclease of predicted toxin-antitoxin system